MSHKKYKSGSLFLLLMLLSATTWSAASIFPGKVYGNLGFFYTGTQTGEGVRSNSTNTTLSLNLDSYVWRPWFMTYNFGGTGSVTKNESSIGSSGVDLLSTHANFALLPRSRYPFRLTVSTNDNVDEWLSSEKTVINFGTRFRSRYLNARQSLITLSGDRYDGWYTRRSRNYSGIDQNDNTFGAKAKVRGKSQNLYANATYQWRDNSANNTETKNIVGSVVHNYFPSSDFYIKTLMTKTYANDSGSTPNSSVFGERTTNLNQMSSFFYWRPVYKAYTSTGGLRAHQRVVKIEGVDSTQVGVDANLAGNYTLTRRLRLTATANASILNSENIAVISNSNQSMLLSYRSDRVRYRDIGYQWYGSGGIGNKVNVSNETFEEVSQTLNAGVGHSGQKTWTTGNRSSVSVNMSQSVREFIRFKEEDSSLSLSHSASVNWNEEMRKGQFYTQLTALDTRNINDKTEMQIINYQLSRVMPVTRLSQWGFHLSAQSSRRYTEGDEEKDFVGGFLTAISGRLNYQHGRLFGIYKLKLRTKLDVTSTANRDGGDRKQADWLGRLGYNVGKLSTALIGRWVFSDSGLGTKVVYLQLNRSF